MNWEVFTGGTDTGEEFTTPWALMPVLGEVLLVTVLHSFPRTLSQLLDSLPARQSSLPAYSLHSLPDSLYQPVGYARCQH